MNSPTGKARLLQELKVLIAHRPSHGQGVKTVQRQNNFQRQHPLFGYDAQHLAMGKKPSQKSPN